MIDAANLTLTDCDREPIHIPGAIQPHGLLVRLSDSGDVVQGAGDIEALTGVDDWLNRPLADLIGADLARAARQVEAAVSTFVGRWQDQAGVPHDVSALRGPRGLLVELERASDEGVMSVARMAQLDEAAAAFERTRTLDQLTDEAARTFRRLTGFDRVMIYRFLEDDSGCVVAEAHAEGMASFLNQHFPAGDIPRQARALYVQNPVRIIPDAGYTPRPLRPAEGDPPLDLSECVLRSVSPVHLQYLRNMGVGASASISIVIDGRLWGLVACHHNTPRLMDRETRAVAAVLARNLARQIQGRMEATAYRERVEQRLMEERLIAGLPLDRTLMDGLAAELPSLMRLVGATGLAVVGERDIHQTGLTPDTPALIAMADWLRARPHGRLVVSRCLEKLTPLGKPWVREASGLVGAVVGGAEPVCLLWFRAEHVETVRWAGDPHAGVRNGPPSALTPRASFDAWVETVQGQSRPWTPAEVESAQRFRDALVEFSEIRALRRRNSSLAAEVADRDHRLVRQDFLLREVNHRVQNSLQLISSFLGLQVREHGGGPGSPALEEARRRVKAVSLVHSRLYRSETVETVDLARYLSELIDDLGEASGPEWGDHIRTDLAPLAIEPERAVTVGLIFTELVINAQKYAYSGEPGPISVTLEPLDSRVSLRVADQGKGEHTKGKGFGSRMVESMAQQLGGSMSYSRGKTGLTADLIIPARLDSNE